MTDYTIHAASVIIHHVDNGEPADDVRRHVEEAVMSSDSSRSSSEAGVVAAADDTRLTAAVRIL